MNLRLIDGNTIQGSSKWIPKSVVQDTKIYQETFTATKSVANTTNQIGGRDNSNIPNQTSNQSVAQNSSESNSHIYEDDIIKVRVVGASFDKTRGLQASFSIQNKTTQDLLLALEEQYPTVISDSGESGKCRIEGIKTYVRTKTSTPSSYSRLKPKQKLSVSISQCGNSNNNYPLAKVNSFSINMPLVRLIDEQPTQPFTVDISDIPVRQK